MHVFTYGTLMFPQVWNAVAGRPYASVAGTASGYAIYRVRDAVFPGIIAAGAGNLVSGVVYLDVDAASIERLDRFEDDFYQRIAIRVACDDGEQRQAETFMVPTEHGSVLTREPWDRDSFVCSGGLDEFLRRFEGFSRLN